LVVVIILAERTMEHAAHAIADDDLIQEELSRVFEAKMISPSREEGESPAAQVEGEPQQCQESLDIQTLRGLEQQAVLGEGVGKLIRPFQMLKRGAVAVVGGSLVTVGLIMIPLPTPCGALVAASGMAVLGNEFESARAANDNFLNKTKGHLSTARDKLAARIESLDGDDSSEQSISVQDAYCQDVFTQSPSGLYMNPKERERQEELLKERRRKKRQTTLQQTKLYFMKQTSSFLSQKVLPLLTRNKEAPESVNTKDELESGDYSKEEHAKTPILSQQREEESPSEPASLRAEDQFKWIDAAKRLDVPEPES
jgi:hypothetical protein